ncbi:MAG: T9SS type A sorting domain-containing protein, partial [Chitinophagales bacterium]
QGDFEEHYDIVVYDNLGKEVLKEQLVEVLDMSFAAEGTYLYTITDKQNVIRQAGQLIKH